MKLPLHPSVLLLLLLGGLVCPASSQESPTEPIGLLLKCPAGLQVSRKGTLIDVVMFFRLRAGDRLTAPMQGGVELVHTLSGKHYRLQEGQSAVIAPNGVWLTPKTTAKGARKPLLQASVVRNHTPAPLANLSLNANRILLGGISRGVEVENPLHQPRPYGAVSTAGSLTLRWINTLTVEQLAGKGLELTLRSDVERDPLLVVNLPGKASSFTVPEGKLQEGTLYTWEVTRGRRRAEASFWILTTVEQQSVSSARSRAEIASKAAPKDPVPLLLLAELLRAEGLFSDALVTLKEAQKRDATNTLTKLAIEELERIIPF